MKKMENSQNSNSKKVLVGLSGGVDSSVAAALLKEQGYSVEGAYMRCWSEGAYCSADLDQADAAKVASSLEIPFHVFNFEKEYKDKVIGYFFDEYEAGRTPNPDVMCNKEIKFGLFLNKAQKLGFDYIATGHYSRIQNSKFRMQNGKKVPAYSLLVGRDSEKDQSYFLYLLNQEALAKTIFPLGDMTKKQVRKLAKEYDLPTADKKDSSGICFVGPVDIRQFLMQKIQTSQGDVVSLQGEVIGTHLGLSFYTIGQREGLGISASVPYYVVDKDVTSNRLIVAPFGHEALFKKKFLISQINWVGREPQKEDNLEVKLRYRAKNKAVKSLKAIDGRVEVELVETERAVTPGQAVVFYKESEVIGGAVIDKVLN